MAMRSPDPSCQRHASLRRIALSLVGVLLFSLGRPGFAAETFWITEPQRHEFDGRSDDLLTAGLGTAGLRGAIPELDDPLQPTWSSLRRRAIAQSWRALADQRPDQGFGKTHGPLSDARLAGVEYLALLRDPLIKGGRFTLWLQIPLGFDPQQPCLVVAAASGSRGVFGSLPTAAERALQRGCAVVHNDKGLGPALLDLSAERTLSHDGRLVAMDDRTALWPRQNLASTADTPAHTLLMKHAQSGDHPEARWGRLLLRSGEAALALLNREFAAGKKRFTPRNTLIIAAGISNGGAAALQALEIDRGTFFDAAVVGEPNVQTFGAPSLYEYATLHGLLQPCAILAEDLTAIPLGVVVSFAVQRHRDWCDQLAASGKLTGANTDELARGARSRLLEAGILPEALQLGALNLQFGLWPSIGATYASAYARNRDAMLPCRLSFAAVDAQGLPRALQPRELVAAYADSSGIAPTAAIGLVGETTEGVRNAAVAMDFSTARCLHELAPQWSRAIDETRVRARPGRRPVLIVHGREDALIPVALSSRAYLERAVIASPPGTELRYFEIDRAQHFDAFLAVPGMGRAQALQPHLNTAFDLLLERLRHGRALPPSQRVEASISLAPSKPITFVAGRLVVPD